MVSDGSYPAIVSAYAEGVRTFFEPGAPLKGERAGITPVSVTGRAGRAGTLLPLSAGLVVSANARLAIEDPSERQQATICLLAKALTDLEVSQALFQAASEEKGGSEVRQIERGAALTRPADLDHVLQLMSGIETEAMGLTQRGLYLPSTIESARPYLTGNVQTTLRLIRDRAAGAGWEALGGIAGLGAGQLAQAAGLVGMDVAGLLGQTARITRLYELVRGFLGQAISSVKALLGPALAQAVGTQVVTWIKEAAGSIKFGRLLEKLYQTEAAAADLGIKIKESAAGLPRLIAAIRGIDALEAAYRKQIELINKILKAMKFIALIPPAALPQGKLVLAAVYMLMGGYSVLAGGDFSDAPNLKLIDRVAGVRRILEANLA
jgi:hypothetical protein